MRMTRMEGHWRSDLLWCDSMVPPSLERCSKAAELPATLGSMHLGCAVAARLLLWLVYSVDQTTLGHRFLKNELNVIPLVGWQVDPFGHSNTHASLISAFSGFLSTFQGRADFQEYNQMCDDKGREFTWQASESMPYSKILGGVLLYNLYCAPPHFSWDVRTRGGNPIASDDALTDYDLPHRVEEFVQLANSLGDMTLGENQLWTMGCDFNYMASDFWYKNMDRIIDAVNKDGRVETFYSTPLEYTQAKLGENLTFPVRKVDFFPYEDWTYSFWTGYYTSRPAFKRYVRDMSGFFSVSRQIAAAAGHPHDDYLPAMAKAMGLAQHHDAVTGTSKQHVVFDYAQRLSIASANLRTAMSAQFNEMIGNATRSTSTPSYAWTECFRANETYCPVTHDTLGKSQGAVHVAVWNQLAYDRDMIVRIPIPEFNVTIDGPLVESHQLYFSAAALTNYELQPNNHELIWTLAVYLKSVPALGFTVFSIKTDSLFEQQQHEDHANHGSPDDIIAKAFKTTRLTKNGGGVTETKSKKTKKQQKAIINQQRRGRRLKDGETISNEFVELHFNATTGRLSTVEDLQSGLVVEVSHNWCYYNSNPGDNLSGQASGAYVFRPETNGTCIDVTTSSTTGALGKVDTRLISEFSHSARFESDNVGNSNAVETIIEQTFADWLTQRIRLPKNARHFEVEFTVGAIPINPEGIHGKEVVSKWRTNISNQATWYTDSNGRELQKRQFNYRPTYKFTNTEPIAGNYDPINAYAEIHDDTAQLSVLVDASNGGSSLRDGELEIMVHRRMLKDDGKGVNEVLNETQWAESYYYNKPTDFGLSPGFHYGPGLIIRGEHTITVLPRGGADTPAKVNRPLMDKVYARTRPFIAPALMTTTSGGGVDGMEDGSSSSSLLSNITIGYMNRNFPINIQLTTLELLNSTTMLLRLAHQFAVNEDPVLSAPTTVDLENIFSSAAGFKMESFEEWSLTANQKLHEMVNIEIPPSVQDPTSKPWVVTLGPMEVRTYVVKLSP